MLTISLLFVITSCNKNGDKVVDNNANDSSDNSTQTENKNFEGLSFVDVSFTYDGFEHSISVFGLPSGANVSYSPSNTQTEVGVYKITATVTADNYNTSILTATLSDGIQIGTDLNVPLFLDIRKSHNFTGLKIIVESKQE